MDKKSLQLINKISGKYKLDFKLDLNDEHSNFNLLPTVIYTLYEKSDVKVVSKLIKFFYTRFIKEIKRSNFHSIDVFNHLFFPLLGKINQIQDSSISVFVKKIVDSILSYQRTSFILLLIFEDLINLYDIKERNRIVRTYSMEDLLKTFNKSMYSEYFPDASGDFKCYLNRLLKIDSLGIKFLMKLLLSDDLNVNFNVLLTFLVSDIRERENSEKFIPLIKKEIINSFIELDYTKNKLFFFPDDCGYSLIEFLEEEDILTIYNNSNSRFLEKIEDIMNTFLSCPDEIENILFLLDEAGIPLLFKCMRKEGWSVYNILEHFKKLGKKLIEPFLEEVIYKNYYYGDPIFELYKIFLNSQTNVELKDLVKKNDYEFIKNLIKKYERDHHHNSSYFIDMIFFRLGISFEDDEYIMLPESLKKQLVWFREDPFF